MLVLTAGRRRSNPSRNESMHVPVAKGSVWTQQTSEGPREVVIVDDQNNFTPVEPPAPPAEQSLWEQASTWVETNVPGGWLTVAGGTGVAAYLLLVPPPKKTKTKPLAKSQMGAK